jgi:hypothetical protein
MDMTLPTAADYAYSDAQTAKKSLKMAMDKIESLERRVLSLEREGLASQKRQSIADAGAGGK